MKTTKTVYQVKTLANGRNFVGLYTPEIIFLISEMGVEILEITDSNQNVFSFLDIAKLHTENNAWAD